MTQAWRGGPTVIGSYIQTKNCGFFVYKNLELNLEKKYPKMLRNIRGNFFYYIVCCRVAWEYIQLFLFINLKWLHAYMQLMQVNTAKL